MGYGAATANSANVRFDFDGALQAARDLWKLADKVEAKQVSFKNASDLALPDWEGVHRTTFDEKVAATGTLASSVAESLRELANQIAADWARARGQQDRINKARYVDHETSNDSWGENFVEHFTGEDDYGPPPEDPEPPGGGAFDSTRDPMYPEFENG